MCAAILLGVTGYLCAIFLTVLAGVGILQIMGIWQGVSLTTLFVCLAVIAVLRGILHYGEQACNHYIAFKLLALIRHKVFAVLRKLCPLAVLRGILHYGEQACNHYIAFKLLALIRHKVFAVLRKLCPAKLDGRDKGNLICTMGSRPAIIILRLNCLH